MVSAERTGEPQAFLGVGVNMKRGVDRDWEG